MRLALPTTNYNNNQKLSVRAQKGQPKCLEGGRHSGCSLATYGLESRSEFILQSLRNS